jgi:hypothetical protein
VKKFLKYKVQITLSLATTLGWVVVATYLSRYLDHLQLENFLRSLERLDTKITKICELLVAVKVEGCHNIFCSETIIGEDVSNSFSKRKAPTQTPNIN